MITSPANPKLRYTRHLARRSFRARERRMLVEGVRLVEEALTAGHRPAFALATAELDATQRGLALRAALRAADVPLLDLAPELLADLAETQQPQGILAILPWPELPLPEDASLLLLLDGVRDPGNLGAMLRAADAAGIDGVLLAPGTVDWSNPKVLRAAMGAHFHLPVRHADWSAIDALLARMRPPPAVWLAEAGGEHGHSEVDWCAPSVILIGGEAEGASAEGAARATGRVGIRMPGRAESLNAGSAAAVLLFEALRQRGALRPDEARP